jgi:hypothetical protein
MNLRQIKEFQFFLLGLGFYKSKVDGEIGPMTKEAIKKFQLANGLGADGIIGSKTLEKAVSMGFMRSEFPVKPKNLWALDSKQREAKFGKFKWEAGHSLTDRDAITIKGDWEDENIVNINIPQLVAIKGSPNVRCHRLVANQLIGLFQAFEDKGLMKYILSWQGMFYPRFMRKQYGKLSNHAWGTAFDINAEWNGLGVTPALVGEKGSVRLLVETALEFGFYWGGWFKDGMHFECYKII